MPISNEDFAALVTQMVETADIWGVGVDQYFAWMSGTATGGPNNDGRYPFTSRDGITKLVPCPAKIITYVPTGQPCAIPIPVFGRNTRLRELVAANGIRSPWEMVVTSVRANLWVPSVAPFGNIESSINYTTSDGATAYSLLSAPVSILPLKTTSMATGTPAPVIANPIIPDDAWITVDCDAYGVGAKGLTVTLIGYKNA